MPDEPIFAMGQRVRLHSNPDQVGAIIGLPARQQGQFWYTIFFAAGRTQTHPEEDLEAYEGESDIASMLRDGRFAGREALSKLVTHVKLTTDLRSQIYSLFASRTRFYPYQFKPVLKFLESRNHRLLIADEVGLGKTIEAGLILTELRQRRPDMSRVLIVPPSHLRTKWRDEMRRRFDRHFRILDRRDVETFLRDYERDESDTELWGIVSLQTLRSARLMEHWEEVGPELDLVVFDEAGRLRNRETLSNRAASLVSEGADAVVLLTATPVQTGAEDLFYLLRILSPDEFESLDVFNAQLRANEHVLGAMGVMRAAGGSTAEALERLRAVEGTAVAARFHGNPIYRDVVDRLSRLESVTHQERIELQRDIAAVSVFGHVLSRTRKREVDEKQAIRRARVLTCGPTATEEEFYEEVSRICRDAYSSAIDRRGASFGIIQRQRQMASCMVAMVDTLLSLQADSSLDAELDEAELEDDEPVPIQPKWEELGNLLSWRKRLEAQDSKFDGLLQALRDFQRVEANPKVILFAFFKRTIHYLARRLETAGVPCLVLTGDTPTDPNNPEEDERLKTIERFRSDAGIQVLLATEVADEGLDLQFAHCLMNYDLPWNPMRIEQRIGRVDRIGQESDVIQIVNLSMPGTIEDRILELLFERIGIFEQSIGDLETILGGIVSDLERTLFSRELSVAEQEHRIREAADVIERKRQSSERLQAQAESLIGHDEFFLDEIERARHRKRFVGGEELLLYLADFLKEQHRTCKLRPERTRDAVYSLSVSEGLRQYLRSTLPAGDRELLRFLGRTARGDVNFTASPELAEIDPSLEFLTFYHPLIRAVNRHYEAHASDLHPVSHVRLVSREVPEGLYAWFLYLTEISGARPSKDLEMVAVRLSDGEALGPDESETLLWELVARSDSTPEARRVGGVPSEIGRAAAEILTERLGRRFEERKRANEALVANRLASLRETFGRNKRIRKERLDAAIVNQRQPAYLRGLETRLRNLESEFERKSAEIEATREMSRSYELRGAGVVEVTHEG